MNTSILQFLKTNGEKLDAEISKALHIPMAQLKTQVAQLSAAGDVICCNVTRYVEGKKIEGISCRLSCDLPSPARGRKPGAAKKDPNADLHLL
jgi:hypothetical protein